MDTIKKNLNYIGLALFFLALVAIRVWPYKKFVALILAGLGIVAIGVYIGLNIAELRQGLKRRSFIYSSNALLVAVLVLAILVVVNLFFSGITSALTSPNPSCTAFPTNRSPSSRTLKATSTSSVSFEKETWAGRGWRPCSKFMAITLRKSNMSSSTPTKIPA